MARSQREKGCRGENRCQDYLASLGFSTVKVSAGERGHRSGVRGWDLEAWLGGDNGRASAWRVQVKEVAQKCPSIPSIMQAATLGFVHFTTGRRRSYVIVDADDLRQFAAEVVQLTGAGKEREE